MRYDTAAKKAASAGRYGDTEIVHVSKDEIDLFNSVSPIPLSTNPKTGAKEAFLLPLIGGLLGSNLMGGLLGGTLGSAALEGAIGSAIGSGIGSLAQGDDPTTAMLSAGMGGIGSYAMGGMGDMFGGASGAASVPTASAAAAPGTVGGPATGVGAATGAFAGLPAEGAVSSTSPTGGIMGWIKDNPLLAAGGAALALPMLTGGMGTEKKESENKSNKNYGGGWPGNPYTGGNAVFPGNGYQPGKDPEWDYFAPFNRGGIVRYAMGGGVGPGGAGGRGNGGGAEGAGVMADRFNAMPRSFVPFDPNAPKPTLQNGQANPAYADYKPPAPVVRGSTVSSPYAYMLQYMANQRATQAGAPPQMFGGSPRTMGAGGVGGLSPLGIRGFAGGGSVIGNLGKDMAEGIDNNVSGNLAASGPLGGIAQGLSEGIGAMAPTGRPQAAQPDIKDPVVQGVIRAIRGEGGDPKPAIRAFIERYGAAPLERLMAIYGPGGMADKATRQASDGTSDSVPAMIDGQQPAALSEGEFVIPADAVSGLGNGSTEAGAKTLQQMIDRIRQVKTGTARAAPDLNQMKALPA